MAQSTFTCPVCGQTLSAGDTFCGNCGFEIHILTEPVSEKILSYEKERVKKFRSILDGNSSMKTGLESSLSEARSEAEEAKEKASSLEERIKEERKDRELLEKDLSREKEASASLKEEVDRLKKENESRKGEKPVASLFAVKGGTRRIYFLYDGDNLFGSRSSSPSCQQVNISSSGMVGDHFIVKVDRKDGSVRVEKMKGEVTLPSSRHSLSNGERFTAGNVEFTLFVN